MCFSLFYFSCLVLKYGLITEFTSRDHTPNLSTGAKDSVTVNGRSGSLRREKYGFISILVTLNTAYCVIEDQQCSDWRLVALWTNPELQVCAYKTLMFHRRSAKMFLSSEKMNRPFKIFFRKTQKIYLEKSVCNKQNPKQNCSPDSFPSVSFWTSCEKTKQQIFLPKAPWRTTSNNQRLRNAGENDRRPKHFCSSTVLCISFTWQMVKTWVIRLQVGRRSKHVWLNCVLATYIQRMRNNSP